MVLVAVQLFVLGSVPPAGVRVAATNESAPHNHFTVLSRRRCVQDRASRRIRYACNVANCWCLGLYLPPVLKGAPPSSPPQMIIAVAVHTAV